MGCFPRISSWAILTHSLREWRMKDEKPKSCEIPGLKIQTWVTWRVKGYAFRW
jgi:hypothetical protein